MSELLEELRYVTHNAFGSKKNDGCDLISQLIMIDIIYPYDSGELPLNPKVSKGPTASVYSNLKRSRLIPPKSSSALSSYC